MTEVAVGDAALSQVLETNQRTSTIRVLLVDDQKVIIESVRQMLSGDSDIEFHYTQDPSEALQLAEEVQPTVILQDLMMPEIDGLVLVKYFRANAKTRQVPMIVLSAEEEPKIKAKAFELGANDYVVKLPDKVELIARIRYHSQSYNRLLERNEAYSRLEQSQEVLKNELADAAEYVRTLLPEPLHDGRVSAIWRFIPSAMLGGDSFGYHWLDDDHFAIYLLDVCGHGVGAALLSISVTNVLLTQALANTDFYQPHEVLGALNEAFQMEQHRNMFFTMWYGVYNAKTRRLLYASGGHPPAVLISGSGPHDQQVHMLKTPGLVVGGMPGTSFTSDEVEVGAFNKLFVFSDGVYELSGVEGIVVELDDLADFMAKECSDQNEDLERILTLARDTNLGRPFPDDFSLLRVQFEQ